MSWSRVLLEKLIGPSLINSPHFREPWFITVSLFGHSKNCYNVTDPKVSTVLQNSVTYLKPVSITAISLLPPLLYLFIVWMYRGNTQFIHVYEANELFTKCCCCSLWMEVVTEFMLSFVGWNTGSIHTCQCSYKKMCWVRVSVSGCLTDGGCSIVCSQIQNDMLWKICLKLYTQANKMNWLFYIIKISGWGLFDLKWTMAKKNIHSGRSVKIAECTLDT